MALMNRQQALVALALVAVALLAFEASAAITCGQVGSAIAPCILYATGRGPLTQGCCNGVRSLNNAASKSADRQAACRCLKSLAGSIKQLNVVDAIAGIPGKCRVAVPFLLSLSTDCNKVH